MYYNKIESADKDGAARATQMAVPFNPEGPSRLYSPKSIFKTSGKHESPSTINLKAPLLRPDLRASLENSLSSSALDIGLRNQAGIEEDSHTKLSLESRQLPRATLQAKPKEGELALNKSQFFVKTKMEQSDVIVGVTKKGFKGQKYEKVGQQKKLQHVMQIHSNVSQPGFTKATSLSTLPNMPSASSIQFLRGMPSVQQFQTLDDPI